MPTEFSKDALSGYCICQLRLGTTDRGKLTIIRSDRVQSLVEENHYRIEKNRQKDVLGQVWYKFPTYLKLDQVNCLIESS